MPNRRKVVFSEVLGEKSVLPPHSGVNACFEFFR
jgi:hypothetical protein